MILRAGVGRAPGRPCPALAVPILFQKPMHCCLHCPTCLRCIPPVMLSEVQTGRGRDWRWHTMLKAGRHQQRVSVTRGVKWSTRRWAGLPDGGALPHKPHCGYSKTCCNTMVWFGKGREAFNGPKGERCRAQAGHCTRWFFVPDTWLETWEGWLLPIMPFPG